MKRLIVEGLLFVILVLVSVQAYISNLEELTRTYAFRMEIPKLGLFKTSFELPIAAYFGLCILIGAILTSLFSLAAVIKASLDARRANRELRDCREELNRLRGPAEDDPVYRAPADVDRPKN